MIQNTEKKIKNAQAKLGLDQGSAKDANPRLKISANFGPEKPKIQFSIPMLRNSQL